MQLITEVCNFSLSFTGYPGFRKTHHKDWFDEQDSEARRLLDDMHEKHLLWMNDKNSSAKKSVYVQECSSAQRKLRQMKETWLSATALLAADRHDMKSFYDSLKAVYGPRDTGSIPVCSKDGKTLITDRAVDPSAAKFGRRRRKKVKPKIRRKKIRPAIRRRKRENSAAAEFVIGYQNYLSFSGQIPYSLLLSYIRLLLVYTGVFCKCVSKDYRASEV